MPVAEVTVAPATATRSLSRVYKERWQPLWFPRLSHSLFHLPHIHLQQRCLALFVRRPIQWPLHSIMNTTTNNSLLAAAYFHSTFHSLKPLLILTINNCVVQHEVL